MAEKKDYLSQLAAEIDGKKPESFKEEKIEDEEFEDVLKMAGISIESYISMSKNKLFSKLTDAIEFMILILILLVRPTGIMGKVRREKV